MISPQQAELRYQQIGLTAGYGILQFMAETTRAVDEYFRKAKNFRDVNSIFGEGPSPKLRRMVAGLRD